MTKDILEGEERKITGRKVKNLRKSGVVPANIFGKNVKSKSIQVKTKDFQGTYKKVGETGIVYLKLDKEEVPVLVHDVQIHPVTDEVLHVNFFQVNLKEKVTASIPVEVIGESPAEKGGIGTVVLLQQEIEVEALPTELPDKFEVDATKLAEVDQLVKVSDLKIDSDKVKVLTDAETIVVKVEPPQKEEVVAAPVAAEGEVPAEGAKPAEGETPVVEEKPQEKK